ncbi:MAG TPA: glycerophosphodiester phosphodiesterase [Gemmatimonadota bacterium]|nr:glycerophosphodiester phosphodiesterase [Gemmatimonadota bacterium]
MIDWTNLRAAVRQLRKGQRQFLEFDIFFKLLGLAVLQPPLAWLTGRLISSTGYPAVTNDQLLSFFISLPGLLTVLVFGAGTFAILFVEQTGMQLVDLATDQKRVVNASEVLWLLVKRLAQMTRLGGVLIVLSILAVTPLLALAGITHLSLLSGADINYYLAERPPEFWAAVAIGLLLTGVTILVAVYLLGRWLLCGPILLYEKVNGLAALRRSAELGRGRHLLWTRTLVTWTMALLVIGVLVTVAFNRIGVLLVTVLGTRPQLLLAVLGALIIAYIVCLAALSLVGTAVNSIYINRLYSFAAKLSREEMLRRGSFQHVLRPVVDATFRRANRLAWAAALAIVASSAAAAYAVAQGFGAAEAPAITAHRGSSGHAPENTIAAIEAAIEDGADFAEIDVQETADGVIVMLHDADLMRLAGVAWKIWETQYDSLRRLDVGGWFAPQFEGERIATLREVVAIARGKIDLNIELKYNGHDVALAQRVVTILQEENFIEHAAISSLDIDGLRQVEALDDRIKTGYIVATAVGDLAGIDVDFFSVSTRFANPSRIGRLKRRGKEVHIWTVNDRQQMSTFIDMGVTNILTDYPATLRAMLREREGLDESQRILIAFRNWLRH